MEPDPVAAETNIPIESIVDQQIPIAVDETEPAVIAIGCRLFDDAQGAIVREKTRLSRPAR
jgi:hypothetical protein